MPFFLFCFCCLLFLVHQAGVHFHRDLRYLIDGYLDPLLLMPILLWLSLWEQRWLFRKGKIHVMSRSTIIKLTLSVSFVGEVVFPMLSDSFTSDVFDVVCYFAGSAFYYLFMNKPGKYDFFRN